MNEQTAEFPKFLNLAKPAELSLLQEIVSFIETFNERIGVEEQVKLVTLELFKCFDAQKADFVLKFLSNFRGPLF